MPWQWVNDLLAPGGRKKSMDWDARCPYHACPGNVPLNRNELLVNCHTPPIYRKPKLKFVFKISPFVYQYRCGYCGCLVNWNVETNTEEWTLDNLKREPALYGGKPSYGFKG